MRTLCEACGAETDQRYGHRLKLTALGGIDDWPYAGRCWCGPCGERVLDAIDSVTNTEMASVVPLSRPNA
jgi:hypothetical protein